MAHVLVVDDDTHVRSLIQEVLDMQGHTFDEAVDGSEAVDRAGRKHYDLMIIDRNMPKMNGVQAITLIRANPKCKDLKIIMCTSAAIIQEIEEAFKAGANDYTLKPISLQALMGTIQKLLA